MLSTTTRTHARFRRLVVVAPLVLLLAVAAALYVFGRNHTPDYSGTGLFGRTAQDTLPLKSWLATSVLGLAVFQLGSDSGCTR